MNTRLLSRANSGDPSYVQPQRSLSSLLAGTAFVPMMLLGLPEAAVGADRRTRRAGGRFRPRAAAGRRGIRRAAGSHEPWRL
jgi:hypothetical protein